MCPNLDARQRRAIRLGVAGAVLAFLTLAGVQALAVRPHLPPDELYHVGYAATVLDGRLPTLTDPVPAGRVPLMPDDGRPRRVYVASHPPLFYAVTAGPIWLGERLGAPRAGFLAARLLSASLAAAAWCWPGHLAGPAARPRAATGGGRGRLAGGAAAEPPACGGLRLQRRAGVPGRHRRPGRGRPGRPPGPGPADRGAGAGHRRRGRRGGGSAVWFYLRNRSLHGAELAP